MKTFNYLSFLLLIAIIGTSIYIAVQPNEFSFSRSRIINAPTPVLFSKVNDFKNWKEFSPWMDQSSNNIKYGNKTVGVNGFYSWDNNSLGEGSIKTLAANENQFISQHITYMKPFESESDIHWNFEPTEAGTKVTWTMKGEQNFISKMYTTFGRSVEKNMSPQLDRGLFKLDSTVTADMKKYSITVNGTTEHGGGYYIYNTTSCKIEDLTSTIEEMLPKVKAYALKNNIAMAGAPFVKYIAWDEENNAVIFSSCVPTTDRVITTESDILTGELPTFRALKTTLKGNDSNLNEARETAKNYIPKNGLEMAEEGIMLEVYITDKTKYPNPADWITDIYIAIK